MKFERFALTELIVIALFSGLLFVIEISIYSIASTNPLGTGIVLFFIGGTLVVLLKLLIRKFWTATLYGLLFGILMIPTPFTGLPGPMKLLLITPPIFVFDLICLIPSKKLLPKYMAASITTVILTLIIFIVLLIQLGLPAAKSLLNILPFAFIIAIVQAIAATFVGYYIYKKIENKSFVRRLRAMK